MRSAKELGGGACEIFEPGSVTEGSARLWLAREIRESLEQGHIWIMPSGNGLPPPIRRCV